MTSSRRGCGLHIVPVRTIPNRQLQGVECINAEGKKQTFGKKLGGCFMFGDERQRTAAGTSTRVGHLPLSRFVITAPGFRLRVWQNAARQRG